MATGPVYMNATPHHSKVRVSIALSSPLFIAGQDVTGKMEMECRADIEVGIGLIMVELFAIQELNSRDHSASSTFLHTRRLFQGPGLPPSNAVEPHSRPNEPPFPPGYFPARRGTTSFFFRFPLPLSSPSSISFASGLAKLRYEVRASVGVSHRGEKRVVTDVAETEIVQCEDMDGATAEHVVVGENGKMYVHGRIAGGRLVSGQQACLELLVRNHSSKKTTGLTLTLTRVLHLHNAATTSQTPLQFSDILCSQTFRGNEYCVQPGAEGVASLVFDVPKAARVVKGGIRENADDGEGGRRRTEPLFELQCILSVKIGMGIGHKDVVFEMQVQLSHPATTPDPILASEPYASPKSGPYPAAPDAVYGPQSPRTMSPFFHLPNPFVTRSPGPESIASSPQYPYSSPPIPSSSASPQQYHHSPLSNPPYALPSPHRRLWSPPPPIISPLPYYFPNSQNAYFFPPPPVTLLPFAYPARPSSAGVGQLHSTSPANGLPGVDTTPVHPGFDQRQQKTDVSADSQSHFNPQANMPVDSGGEEGKGARASRISHHLRTSTRARSMSPTSHRFPTPSSHLPPTAIVLHATSPRHRDGPPVLSPRPMPSPRNSITADAAADSIVQDAFGTAPSERVGLLERLVDLEPGEEGKSVEDVLNDLERVKQEMETDKTLPKPPFPSGNVEVLKKVSNIPKASEVFSLRAPVGGFEKMEDVPKKSVLRPSPMARRIGSHEMDREQVGRDERGVGVEALRPSSKQHSNGLEALEKRLLLEVGTRKPDTSNRPTLFELGIAAPAPAVPAQLNTGESEISSLALASKGSPDFNRGKAGQRASSTSMPAYLPATPRTHSEEKAKVERSVRTVADDKDRLLSTRKERLREEKSKEQEVVKLRKAAKGRVADWLGDIAARSEPNEEVDHGPNSQPSRGTDITDKISLGRRSSSDKTLVSIPSMPSTPLLIPVDVSPNGMRSNISPLSARPSSPLVEHRSKPDVSDDKLPALDSSMSAASVPPKITSPNSPRLRKLVSPLDDTISEGNQFLSTPAAIPGKVAGHLAKLQLPQGIPETKYDVRSARGGRGGITTSVAALWTSLAQEGKEDHVKPPTKPVTRKLVTQPAFLDVGKPKSIPTFRGTSPDPTSRQSDNAPTPVLSTMHPPQPRNCVKSASVPASVNPSHAKPYLSSTASLARPPTILSKPKPPMLSSTLSESIPEDTSNNISPPAFPRDMAFGKARLKDLIKKYQEAAS